MSVSGSQVLIEDVPALATSKVAWSLRAGTQPVKASFDIRTEDLGVLVDAGPATPVKLTIGGGGDTEVFENLYVLRQSPGPNPHITRVLLSDLRWIWQYPHILRRFNMRRSVGYWRLDAPNRDELKKVNDLIQYAPFSMKDSTGDGSPDEAWKTSEALDEILRILVQAEKEFSGHVPAISGIRQMSDYFDDLPLENVEIDDRGDMALQRIMNYLPKVSVTVTQQGNIQIFSRVDGGEKDIVESLLPEMDSRGHVEVIERFRLRPSVVEVLFTREHELRFDYEEAAGGYASTRDRDARTMENVLPIPDYELSVGGETLCQGTWITMEDAWNAWGEIPGFGSPLTHTLIQRALCPYVDDWIGLQQGGLQQPDVNWMARLNAVRQHYRRTFRINNRWMSRIHRLMSKRVAIIDPVTGTTAPATAYADYSLIGSQRSKIRDAYVGADIGYAINCKVYPAGGIIDAETLPAPANVVIMEEEQGIIRLEFLLDAARTYDMVLPSPIVSGGGAFLGTPGPHLREQQYGIGYDLISDDNVQFPQLAGDHKVSIILTGTPGAPNDDELQLHMVPVKPADVVDMLPPSLRAGLNNCHGPKMQVRVRGAVETARVLWNDNRATDIEYAFGFRGDGDPEAPLTRPNLQDLVINETGTAEQVGTAGASLDNISRALAASLYAAMSDQMAGNMGGGLRDGAVPAGWLNAVNFSVTADGVATIDISLPEETPQLSFYSLMDRATRAIVNKLAQPGKVN